MTKTPQRQKNVQRHTFQQALLSTLAVVGIGGTLALSAAIFEPTYSIFRAEDEYLSQRARRAEAEAQRLHFAATTGFFREDGDDITYWSIEQGFRFDRPYNWQGRSPVVTDALQSPGYAPFKISFRGNLEWRKEPEEEIIVVVRSTPNMTVSGVVDTRKAGDSSPSNTTLGGKEALRYRTSEGYEAVTTVFKEKEYTVLLKPIDAGERVKPVFERVLSSFRFIDSRLQVL